MAPSLLSWQWLGIGFTSRCKRYVIAHAPVTGRYEFWDMSQPIIEPIATHFDATVMLEFAERHEAQRLAKAVGMQ